jgi:hypothetical protein
VIPIYSHANQQARIAKLAKIVEELEKANIKQASSEGSD